MYREQAAKIAEDEEKKRKRAEKFGTGAKPASTTGTNGAEASEPVSIVSLSFPRIMIGCEAWSLQAGCKEDKSVGESLFRSRLR